MLYINILNIHTLITLNPKYFHWFLFLNILYHANSVVSLRTKINLRYLIMGIIWIRVIKSVGGPLLNYILPINNGKQFISNMPQTLGTANVSKAFCYSITELIN